MADETNPQIEGQQPGDDYVIGEGDSGSLSLTTAISAYKKEAEEAKRTRMARNRENMDAYMGVQDWSHKKKGQSREFLPKTPAAVEQFVGFAKRALTQFGSWYEVEIGRGGKTPISGGAVKGLMNCFLDDLLVSDNVRSSFPVLLSDGLKVGALESLCIFKVHGNLVPSRSFTVEQLEGGGENLLASETEHWNLRVDLVDPKNYFPDPTGAGLYEIHSVEKDLHRVIADAERGVYDLEAVMRIKTDFEAPQEEERKPDETGQDEEEKPGFRKMVHIDEFWGTIIDGEGNILHENCLCTIANERYVIREPIPNPLWHGESPFVAVPLIRVPFSVWHKALFDNAAQLNFAANELFNLIIDGGLAAVWGIKQVRTDDLEDPGQISDGIPQGETLAVKSSLPHGQKVLETVAEGQVPSDAMAVLEMLSREFSASALSNELKMGAMPPKQVLATEVVELSQSQAITMDAITGDIEQQIIQRLLHKVWLTILQNLDDVSSGRIIDAIGVRAAYALGSMSPAQRYAVFANSPCSFKVHGLSALLARVRDFQKFASLLQVVTTNPLLFQAFFKRYSPDKVLSHMMKMLSINPERIYKDDEELSRLQADFGEMVQMAGLLQGPRQKGVAGQDAGEPGLPAEINSISNPSSGLAGTGES